jgi:hypothetical protein
LGTSFVGTNTNTANGSLTLTDTSAVTFGFLATGSTPASSAITATMVFTASSANSDFNSTSAASGVAYQTGFTGSLAIISTQAVTFDGSTYAAGANLLTATFTNAALQGIFGQQDAGLSADSGNGSVVYSSDFLAFSASITRDYSFAVSAFVPHLSDGLINGSPAYIQSFTSTPTGSFASNPAPVAVPEPATWAMMIVGLSAIGLSLRGKLRRSPRAA